MWSVEVFRAAVVHGFRILEPPNGPLPLPLTPPPAQSVVLVVFGHKSLSILAFCPAERKWYVFSLIVYTF